MLTTKIEKPNKNITPYTGQIRSKTFTDGFILIIGDRQMYNGIELAGKHKGETVYGSFSEHNDERLKRDYPYVHDAELKIFVGGNQ